MGRKGAPPPEPGHVPREGGIRVSHVTHTTMTQAAFRVTSPEKPTLPKTGPYHWHAGWPLER